MKNYQKEASDLLATMGVKFSVKFVKYDFHFEGDKEKRNIYDCVFSRNGNEFSIRFGQSIVNTAKGAPPTAYDVVSCLQKYDVGSFNDFCNEFGYDTDSRKAEKIYKAVCAEFGKVEGFFMSDELEKLEKIN